MALLSLEAILNLVYLASVVVLFGFGQRTVILAGIDSTIGFE